MVEDFLAQCESLDLNPSKSTDSIDVAKKLTHQPNIKCTFLPSQVHLLCACSVGIERYRWRRWWALHVALWLPCWVSSPLCSPMRSVLLRSMQLRVVASTRPIAFQFSFTSLHSKHTKHKNRDEQRGGIESPL
jgi:hypothetical protein